MENPTTLNWVEHNPNPPALHATMKITASNFREYLVPQTQTQPHLIPQSKFRNAFICGYTSALHKTRTFSELLFSQSPADINTNIIMKEVTPLMPLITRTRPDINAYINEFLLAQGDNIHRNNQDLPTAFLAGYLTGIFKSGKYDRALFLYDFQLHATVLADLTMLEKSQEDALRATIRIVRHTYDTKVTNIRGMAFDNPILDDAGEGFDSNGTAGPSQR